MLSLVQAFRRSKSKGAPLPDRFPSLAAADVRFRRGQVHMIAGRPGSGKSLIALDYAVNANVSCLYFSADTDSTTVVERTVSMRQGLKLSEVEALAEAGDDERLVGALEGLGRIRFVFDPSPTLNVIDLELKAMVELYG